ncbi:MAG: penicillin acylase family protein [Myxococcota bacterium]|nr:penicillin acylase family protein [Myxococcota bacterium]
MVLGLGLVFSVWVFAPERARFDAQPLIDAGAEYDVRILRDEYGVPHIYGVTDPDVAYGLAYAHSEDDFATIQEVLLSARGELARWKGASAAPLDMLVRWMGAWDAIAAGYDTELSPEVRALVEAYADGVNHYAALHPRETLPGVIPVTGRDVVAGFASRVPFFFGIQSTVAELFADERASPIATGPIEAAFEHMTHGAELGSNAVAVNRRRSADGATRLLINSHQPFTGPAAWYEVRLKSEAGWDMAGGVFPGSPIVLHGHNRDLGWASTVNRPDLADVYVLETDETGQHYKLDGEWREFERRPNEVDIRLLGRLRTNWMWLASQLSPLPVELLRSEHGPAVQTAHGTYALRYAGMGEIRQVEQWYRMNRATTHEEWTDAMRMLAIPSFNFVYADRKGRIAYYYNAKTPVRAKGWNWQEYLPGDRSDLIWTESYGFDDTPQVVNPRSGYVVSTNQTPFRATALGQGPDEEDFPAEAGFETNMNNRALRAHELYGRDRWITRDEFRKYKYDKRYSKDSRVREVISEVLAAEFDEGTTQREAQELLAGWSYDVEIGNRVTALAIMTAQPVILAERRELPEVPGVLESFKAAVETLLDHHGRLDPTWGEVNRFRRGHLDLPANGGPDVLRALEDFDLNEDGTFVPVSGDTLIYFVEWDRSGNLRSESIHQYGSATLDAKSVHYDDQVEMFLASGTKPVYFDEADLREHLESEYRPGEERRSAR